MCLRAHVLSLDLRIHAWQQQTYETNNGCTSRTWHCSANLSDVCGSASVAGQADISPLSHPCYQPAPLRAPGKDECGDRASGLKSLLGGERDTDDEPSRRHGPHRVSFGHLWEHTISIGEPNESQNESIIGALSSEKRSFQVRAQRAGPPSPALREEVIVSQYFLSFLSLFSCGGDIPT